MQKIEPDEINLYETENAPTIRNVRVGDKIWAMDEDNEQVVTWTVQQVYPYLVYATSGSRKRCFNYGMLVQLGLEDKYTDNYRLKKELLSN